VCSSDLVLCVCVCACVCVCVCVCVPVCVSPFVNVRNKPIMHLQSKKRKILAVKARAIIRSLMVDHYRSLWFHRVVTILNQLM